MTKEETIEYHAKRAEQERELAAAAADPSIQAIHLELADRHAELQNEAASTPRARLSVSNSA